MSFSQENPEVEGGKQQPGMYDLVKCCDILLIKSFREEKVKTIVDDIMEKMPEQFSMSDIMARVEERTPYVIVCFQVKPLVLYNMT